jgi:hypothetical protein
LGKRVAIIQSNYIPWKGYFNIIRNVDAFVLLDDVQYTRRDWRNRNLIKTKTGLKWLSIPVDVKGKFLTAIKDVETAGTAWRVDHWRQITEAYSKCRYFAALRHHFENLYLNDHETNLSTINFKFIALINSLLEMRTPVHQSMQFNAPQEKSERLLHICKALGADEYVSGEAASGYLNVALFNENNIQVRWTDYSGYPEYQQLYPPFEHGVSIIDLLFNEGTQVHHLLKDQLWA